MARRMVGIADLVHEELIMRILAQTLQDRNPRLQSDPMQWGCSRHWTACGLSFKPAKLGNYIKFATDPAICPICNRFKEFARPLVLPSRRECIQARLLRAFILRSGGHSSSLSRARFARSSHADGDETRI
jgi:hypothetical protein